MMNSIFLILAFIVQAHAAEEKAQTSTEQVSAEDEEAMNQLMDILVDDEKNDELVDMIADKLVNKLIGFDAAVMPQRAQAVPQFPVAQVSQFQQQPQVQFGGPRQAPQVNVAYDGSKNAKIDPSKAGAILSRNKNYNSVADSPSATWGVGVTIKGGVNPYGKEPPTVGDRPTGTQLNANGPPKRAYKPGPEYQNFGSADYEKLMGKDGFGAARPMDKAMAGLNPSASADRFDGGSRPKLMEMDEEQPDAITVLAVGMLSACVGSAVTFALFHIGRAAKTGIKEPLLTY